MRHLEQFTKPWARLDPADAIQELRGLADVLERLAHKAEQGGTWRYDKDEILKDTLEAIALMRRRLADLEEPA